MPRQLAPARGRYAAIGMSFDDGSMDSAPERSSRPRLQTVVRERCLFAGLCLERGRYGFLRKRQKTANEIATSWKQSQFKRSLEAVKNGAGFILVVSAKLRVQPSQCFIVGDAVWDAHAALRAGSLTGGPLTVGYGEQDLYNRAQMRVYQDAFHLLASIEELSLE